MLANPIYRGQLIWNRSQWIKDHGADNEKPKRRRYDRPKSEWVRVERPELRIVDDETWAAAQAELQRRAAAYVRTTDGRHLATHTARTAKRKHLLAGFLECAECGGAFYALSRPERYGCAWHRGRGPAACSSTLGVPREALENCVVQALRDTVLAPVHVDYIVNTALAQLEQPLVLVTDAAQLEGQIEEAQRQLLAAAEQGGDVERAASHLRALKARLTRAPSIRRKPELPADVLRRRVVEAALELREALAAAPDEARTALRILLGDRRMQVAADSEHGWRVEGVFEVTAGAQAAEPGPRGHGQVAGGCYGTVPRASPCLANLSRHSPRKRRRGVTTFAPRSTPSVRSVRKNSPSLTI